MEDLLTTEINTKMFSGLQTNFEIRSNF